MISEKYSHNITRKYAETTLLKDSDIYKNVENSKLIDSFIKFYNKLKIIDSNGKEMKLDADNNYLSEINISTNLWRIDNNIGLNC